MTSIPARGPIMLKMPSTREISLPFMPSFSKNTVENRIRKGYPVRASAVFSNRQPIVRGRYFGANSSRFDSQNDDDWSSVCDLSSMNLSMCSSRPEDEYTIMKESFNLLRRIGSALNLLKMYTGVSVSKL